MLPRNLLHSSKVDANLTDTRCFHHNTPLISQISHTNIVKMSVSREKLTVVVVVVLYKLEETYNEQYV